jgi:sister chromatid cohesion protein PDS5
MGMYALAGREPDRRIRGLVRQYMMADVVRRREYIRNITVGTKGTHLTFTLTLPPLHL